MTDAEKLKELGERMEARALESSKGMAFVDDDPELEDDMQADVDLFRGVGRALALVADVVDAAERARRCEHFLGLSDTAFDNETAKFDDALDALGSYLEAVQCP